MKDQRGVVYLETLVAFLPVFLFFLATLQIADLSAAHIIVRHAATVAARAAVVVLPDDGRYYNDEDNEKLHAFDGLRRQDIEYAADLILRANPRLDNAPLNVVVGFQSPPTRPDASPNRFVCSGSGSQPCLSRDEVLAAAFTSQTAGELLDTSTKGEGDWGMREKLDALVTAKYRCMLRFFCPRDFTMVATASLLYQGARYTYEAWPDSIRGDSRPDGTPGAPVGPATQIPGGPPNDGHAPPSNPSTLPDDAVAGQTPNAPAAPGSNSPANPGVSTPPAANLAGPAASTAGSVASNTNPGSSRTSPTNPSGSPGSVASHTTPGSSPTSPWSPSNSAPSSVASNTAPGSSHANLPSSNSARPSLVARPPRDDSSQSESTAVVAGRTDNRAAASSGTHDDATNDSSQVAATTPNRQGTSPDSSTSSSNPAPMRGPPGASSNSQTTPNSIVAGSAHAIDSDNPTLASNTTGRQPSAAAIIASGDRSQTARNGANANRRTSTPRNAAELRGALPSNLRNVPIVHDPSLQGPSVQVHYTHDSNGQVTGIEIRVGPNARARHITDHVNTVRAMQRLQGLSGRVRILLARIGAWISGRPDIRPGSLAWETRREIEKLSAIIDARAQALANTSLTDAQRAELEQELDAYADQLAYHQAAITDITREPGRGYVAANGPDSSVLQQHFAAVRRQLANGTLQQRTEARGEHNAAMHMLRESRDPSSPWYGFQMARGFESGQGYDQVWVRRENGQIVEILIVEAKGRRLSDGTPADLGDTESMGPQMSRTWVLGTAILRMHKTPADAELGNLIAEAMQFGPPPAVYGVVVTGAHVWSGESASGNRAHPGQSYPSVLKPPPNLPVDPTRKAGVYHNTTRQRTAAGPAPTRGLPATTANTAHTPQNIEALRAALPATLRDVPAKLVPGTDGSMVALQLSLATGEFEPSQASLEQIHAAHALTEEAFIDSVEVIRARRWTGAGPLTALYELMNGIEDVAKDQGRQLTSDEAALLKQLRRQSYALFEAEHPNKIALRG